MTVQTFLVTHLLGVNLIKFTLSLQGESIELIWKFIYILTSAERCSSGKVNPNDSMGVEDDVHPMKPPKKGRKIKLTSNGSIPVNTLRETI